MITYDLGGFFLLVRKIHYSLFDRGVKKKISLILMIRQFN